MYIYVMLAAEFHYTEDYVDDYMDLDRFQAHLRYRQNYPPISALFQAFLGTENKPSKPIKPMKDWKEAEEKAKVGKEAFELFKRQILAEGNQIRNGVPGKEI
jgi:hypothetical protein